MKLYSAESEQSVIGACMINPDVIDKLVDRLKTADFYFTENQVLWTTIKALHGKGIPPDVVTLPDELEANNALDDAGGFVRIAECARNTPTWKNAEHYAQGIIELSQRRKLIACLSDATQKVHDRTLPIDQLVDSTQGGVASVLSGYAQDEAGPIGARLTSFLNRLDDKHSGKVDPMGMGFGVSDLDDMTMGMRPSNLVIAAARPKVGKTIFAMNAVRACGLGAKRPVVMFSMEMQVDELMDRMAAAIAEVPQDAIKDPQKYMEDEDWHKLNLLHTLTDAPIVIDDRPALTPSQVRGAAKRWKEHYGDMGLVVVDYIGLMRPDGKHGTREREVAEISGALKGLAKELGCPVLALSQLNRSLEQRPNKRPMLSDLRESGSLEQDADLIVFLYADELYNPENEDNKGIIELIVGAQRAGRTGTVYAARRLDVARIDNLTPESVAKAKQATSKTKSGGSLV